MVHLVVSLYTSHFNVNHNFGGGGDDVVVVSFSSLARNVRPLIPRLCFFVCFFFFGGEGGGD